MYPRCSAQAPQRLRAFSSPRLAAKQSCVRCRAENDASGKGESDVNEGILSKLRQFESENEKLRSQLAAGKDESLPATQEEKRARVDGSGKREGFFGGRSGDWLSEGDVDFMTGGSGSDGGPVMELAEDKQAIINRRLAIGGVLTVATIAFALVPTEELDGSTNKPTYALLLPVIRSISLLEDLSKELEDGNLQSVPIVVDRVLNKPNEVRKNMYAAIEQIDGSQRQSARELVGNFVDYVNEVDYNKYFDTISKGKQDGKSNAQYVDFSMKSAKAAVREGNKFLKLFNSSDIQQAKEAMAI